MVNDDVRAARPDHGQGHPEGDRASERLQGRARAGCASAPRSASASDTEERVERAGRGGRRRARGRHRARPCAGRARPRARGSRSSFPQVAGHRRQRRHRRRRARRWSTTAPTASRSASARARSAPRASSPASACRRSPRSQIVAEALRGTRRAADRRRRHPLLGRHRQGDRRRRVDAVMLGSLFAGTEEAPGEIELFQGRSLQVLSRHGLARRDAAGQSPTATSRTPRRDADKLVPEGIEGRVPYKGSVVARHPSADGRPARQHGLLRLRRRSTRCARSAEFVEITVGRHARIARARRADHQGSAELPRRVSAHVQADARRRRIEYPWPHRLHSDRS